MSTLEYRFTDQTVRRHPELTAIAMEFVDAYDGDFAVILQAKTYLKLNGTLPTAMARTVLNCLRQERDPFWQSLQIEAHSVLAAQERRDHPLVKAQPPVAPPKQRPWEIRVPAFLHYSVMSPRSKSGSLHITEGAQVWWRDPPTDFRRPYRARPVGRVPHLQVWTVCGNHYQDVVFFTEDQMLVAGRNYCRSGCWEEGE